MKNLKVKTKDGINIALNYYPSGHNEVVIVAPGWCMTKDSKPFVKIAGIFIETHRDPDKAPSDGPNMIKLSDMPAVLEKLRTLDKVTKES